MFKNKYVNLKFNFIFSYIMGALFIGRHIETAIIEAAQYFSVITITGPRQSGKTTLIKHLFPHLLYVSLENIQLVEFASNDPIAFLHQNPEGMILDEVQHVPQLLSYIQGIVDADKKKRFILSGSSQFSMLQSITQSLAGRTAIFELLPLSYAEIKPIVSKKTLNELLFEGFYPAIHAQENKAELLYPAYTRTYLERDVRDLLQVKNMMQFQIFLKLCAARIGSLCNASELANEVGVSSHTIQSWLSILQQSYVITLLQPFYENTRKRLTKTPKLYFNDTGIACYLLGIESPQQLERDKMRGHVFENFIVIEALKKRYNEGKDSNIYFYRDSNHNEVDLLIKKNNLFTVIEIKSSQTYSSSFEKGIKNFEANFPDKVHKKKLIYCGDMENENSAIQILNYSNSKIFE